TLSRYRTNGARRALPWAPPRAYHRDHVRHCAAGGVDAVPLGRAVADRSDLLGLFHRRLLGRAVLGAAVRSLWPKAAADLDDQRQLPVLPGPGVRAERADRLRDPVLRGSDERQRGGDPGLYRRRDAAGTPGADAVAAGRG